MQDEQQEEPVATEKDSIEPEVQEYINQDTTVVHDESDSLEYRTPPGVAPGLVPGGPEDREPGPRTPS